MFTLGPYALQSLEHQAHTSQDHLISSVSKAQVTLQGLPLATRLHFEFYSEADPESAEAPGLQIIDMPRLNQHPGNEYEIFCQLVKQYKVPETLRYVLHTPSQHCST